MEGRSQDPKRPPPPPLKKKSDDSDEPYNDAIENGSRASPKKSRLPPQLKKSASTVVNADETSYDAPVAELVSNTDVAPDAKKSTKSKRVPPPLKKSVKAKADGENSKSDDNPATDTSAITFDIETGGEKASRPISVKSSSNVGGTLPSSKRIESTSLKSKNGGVGAQYDVLPTHDAKERGKDKEKEKEKNKDPKEGKEKEIDRFKGNRPLQFAVWAHYLAYGAAAMTLFVSIFAMIWSRPYNFNCKIYGDQIASKYIYDSATQACGATYQRPDGDVIDVCCDADDSENTINGTVPIGALYFVYTWLILLYENTSWGFGLYAPNDTFFYRNKISPIGLIHITIGIVGLSTYSTCLGGACLVTCGLVYSWAAAKQESGDGGRAVAAKAKSKQSEAKRDGTSQQEVNHLDEFKAWWKEFKHNWSCTTIINEDRLSVVIWLSLYFGGNLILFAHTLSEWEEIIEELKAGLLEGTLDISCHDRMCHMYRKAIRYGPISGYAPWAKACGNCLNLNCSLLLLPILKMLLKKLNDAGVSFSRAVNSSDYFSKFFAHPLTRYIPLSKNIEFHKIIACMVFIYSWAHMIFHFLNLISGNNATLQFFRRFEWDGSAYLTGAIATFAGFIIFTAAPNAVKSVKFEIFLGAHHMFILFFLALFLHGRVFIYWSCLPVFLYIVERLLHIWRGNKPFLLLKVEYIQPVMAVHFRPKNKEDFVFKEGQYVYLNCPDISPSEWHPFTISSAYDDMHLGPRIHLETGEEVVEVPRPNDLPSNTKWNKFCLISKDYRKLDRHEYIEKSDTGYHDFISCHIKVHGLDDPYAKTWTRRLKEYFESISGGGVLTVSGEHGVVTKSSYPFYFSRRDQRGDISIGREFGPNGKAILRVDGPHSAPTEHFCNYSTCLLIGAGIGLTPCASVLSALIKHQWKRNFNPKVLQFYWIIRHAELDSFQWFMHMLADLSFELKRLKEKNQIDQDYYCEMNIYLTQYDSKKPAAAKPLQKLKSEASYYSASDLKVMPSFTAKDLYEKCITPTVDSKKQSSKMTGKSAPNRCQDIWIWSGRPDWDDIFFEAKKNRIHKDIGVCYCGVAAMGSDLRNMCQKYSSVDDDVLFSLHKENF